MRRQRTQSPKEPTIALINVVFLMLIFFLIAGTIGPQLDPDLTLVDTSDLDPASPPEGLVVFPDGTLSAQGRQVANVADFLATLPADQRDTVRLIPDQILPAKILLETAAALRGANVSQVLITTERAAQ